MTGHGDGGGPAWPGAGTSGSATTEPAGELVTVSPGALRGRVRVPGDKSVSHRALLLAALSEGRSRISGLSDGDDVRRTALAVVACGARIEAGEVGPPGDGDRPTGRVALPGLSVEVTGGRDGLSEPVQPLDVGNSGTGIRLLAGWLAAFPWLAVLHGDRYLAARPMDRVIEPLRRMGARLDARGDGRFPPLVVRGGALRGIDYPLPVPSAQVKAAVLLAGLAGDGPTTVREPAPLRAHTEELLGRFGASVTTEGDGAVVTVRPGALRPTDLVVPGDPSHAAFWIVAGCVVPGSDVTVEGVYVGRARAGFIDVLRRMGAAVEVTMVDDTTADVRACHAPLSATRVAGAEVAGLIDEIPVLAVAAAFARGVTTFADAAELRVKETDRVATTAALLRGFGVDVEARPDGLVVSGGRPLRGGPVTSAGDHRIAMAGAVAALGATGPSTVRGWEAVATSYPGFLADLAALQA